MLASCFIFFFNDTATTEIYTLSLHDALPIFGTPREWRLCDRHHGGRRRSATPRVRHAPDRGHGSLIRRGLGARIRGEVSNRDLSCDYRCGAMGHAGSMSPAPGAVRATASRRL